jgi:cell division protein FtsQ
MFDHKSRSSARPRKQPLLGGRLNVAWDLLSALWASAWTRRVVMALPLVAMLAWGWSVFDPDALLPINSVQIEGEFRYLKRDDLQRTAMPHVQGGFFSLNLQQVREAILVLPWVEDATVRRQWPDGLRIKVMEKQPAAWWGDGRLLSSRGVLFVPGQIGALALPKLEGPDGLEKILLQELGGMQTELASTGQQIQKIRVDARRSWTVFMASGLELRLGREDEHLRLQRFVDVYGEYFQPRLEQIKHIDMRYTNGLAVAWRHS